MDRQTGSQGESRMGAEFTGELEARLRCQLNGRVQDLRLEVSGGGLVLRGRARTWYAKQLALHALKAVAPVPIVANAIEVL